jgi:iron complex transport system substrate-binding protein
MLFRFIATFSLLAVIGSTAAVAQSFPVTVEHAFGETIIEAAPERIVTWGWGNHDALLALGIVPVAMPFST